MRNACAAAAALAGLVSVPPPLVAGEIPGALVIVEAPLQTPGSLSRGAPPRFVLVKSGELFVGGTSRVETARLERNELAAFRKRIDAARKAVDRLKGADLGAGSASAVRLRLPEAGIDLQVDPASATPALQAVAELVNGLLRYDHPRLVPFAPASYLVEATEARSEGGCRRSRPPFPIERAVATPLVVSAAEAAAWPTGGYPASVCVGERRFVVTLRPLLPGEQP